ncbi:thioredoxin domain-containing protein [Scopulibacillus cellulosilyticus]|uniref:Thioredoxin domain-containing protein n=1 Tax=Scopulibacillus cellulosilyticus TaxID=2665665 RepID=A0ABW2PYT9_9BACL
MSITKLFKLLPLVLLLLISSEDLHTYQVSHALSLFKGHGLHTIVLANDFDHGNNDKQYYYALLMLKDHFPDKDCDVHIYDAKRQPDLAKEFNVNQYPALILLSDNQAIKTIQGKHSWSHIYNQIEPVLTKT